MKFTYDKTTGNWTSSCGDYKIWVQARPLHESPFWGAQYKGKLPWLTDLADGRKGAIEVCKEHREEMLDNKG